MPSAQYDGARQRRVKEQRHLPSLLDTSLPVECAAPVSALLPQLYDAPQPPDTANGHMVMEACS